MNELIGRDPFELIWSTNPEDRTSYAIQRISKDIPIKVTYRKWSLGIAFEMSPSAESELVWVVRGKIDADTFANLGLETSEPRNDRVPPIVTSLDIDQASQKFGPITQDPNNATLFDVELRLPANNVYYFFNMVWQPHDLDKIPLWHLTHPNKSFRDIPVKKTPKSEIKVSLA